MPNLTATFNDSASTLATGQAGDVRSTSKRALHVRLSDDSGAYVAPGGGTTDASSWTTAVSSFSPTGGVYNDSAAALTAGKQGTVRSTENRAMHVNVRDHLGNEATLTGNSLNVNVTNGGAGGTSMADKAAFTVGTTNGTPAFGVARTDVPDLVVDATGVSFASTLRRGIHANIRTQAGVEMIGQQLMAASLPVVIASNQSTLNVALAANQSVNVAQINGVTPLMGTGIMGTGSLRVTIASDNDALTVKQATAANLKTLVDINAAQTLATVTTVSTVTNLSQMAGAAISMGTGVRGVGVQRVTIATDDVVPASQSGTWTVQPGNTANTTPWLIDLKNTGGNAILAGNGTTGTGSIRVTIASDNTAFSVNATCSQATASNLNAQVVGNIATASADSGNPVKVGGVYLSAPGTIATTGNRVNSLVDGQGRLSVSAVPMAWVVNQATTITSSSTETTIVTAGAAGIFNDLVFLMITNSSSTACSITIRDATAGTTRFIVDVAANGGCVVPIPSPGHPQAVAASAWSAQNSSAAVASIHITAICHQRK